METQVSHRIMSNKTFRIKCLRVNPYGTNIYESYKKIIYDSYTKTIYEVIYENIHDSYMKVATFIYEKVALFIYSHIWFIYELYRDYTGFI